MTPHTARHDCAAYVYLKPESTAHINAPL